MSDPTGQEPNGTTCMAMKFYRASGGQNKKRRTPKPRARGHSELGHLPRDCVGRRRQMTTTHPSPEDRHLAVEVASGDALDVRHFSVEERMSALFEVRLV